MKTATYESHAWHGACSGKVRVHAKLNVHAGAAVECIRVDAEGERGQPGRHGGAAAEGAAAVRGQGPVRFWSRCADHCRPC